MMRVLSAVLFLGCVLCGCDSNPDREAAGAPDDAPEARAGRVLKAKKVKQLPTVDGVTDSAWEAIAEMELLCFGAEQQTPVSLKACHDGKTLCVWASWPDADASETYKLWTWSDEQQKYLAGKEKEDRFAIEFPISERFDACMLGGTPYVADVWHWKAARTNGAGRADDEWHQVSVTPFEVNGSAANEFPDSGPDAKTTLYMMRVKDRGQLPTLEVPAPAAKGEPTVQRYYHQEVSEGQADLRAKGIWKDGRWTVEFSRALKSSNSKEDKGFQAGRNYPFAVAVFDKASDAAHQTSPQGRLDVEK